MHKPEKNGRIDFFKFPGHPGVARKLLPLTLESFTGGGGVLDGAGAVDGGRGRRRVGVGDPGRRPEKSVGK